MFNRLYLHTPFCIRKCPYCAFVSRQGGHDDITTYLDVLLVEMRMAAREFIPSKLLDSIYLGGGTPSLLTPHQIARIIEQATSLFGLSAQAELTLEVNPGTVSRDNLAGFRAAGINRLSIGVQSFDDRMLEVLGRIHTVRQAREAFEAARATGFDNIGIDLIHALPGQTIAMWKSELEEALLLAPEHLSVYGLTVEEGTPFAQRYVTDDVLTDDDQAADMFELADDLLTSGGYVHYEIANYARPGRYSDHNSGYWRRDGYLGLGIGAHSLLRDTDFGTRFGNTPDMDEYSSAIRQGKLPRCEINSLSRNDAMSECMFLGLRLTEGVAFSQFEEEFGVPLTTIFGAVLKQLSGTGLIILDETHIRLTRRGMLLSNQILSRFLL